MRYLLSGVIFIFTSLSIGCNKKNSQKTDTEQYGLVGKVKSVKEGMYLGTEKFGETIKGRPMHDYYMTFNQDGGMAEFVSLKAGEVFWKDVYSYDAIKHTKEFITYEEGGNMESKHRNIFQDEKNSIYETYKRDGELVSRTIAKLDDQGNSIEERVYKLEIDLVLTSTESNQYKYDSKNQMTERISTSTDYTKTPPYTGSSTQVYKYDDKGNQIERKFLSDEFPTVFKYDDNNNEIESMSKSNGKESVTKTEYKYDKNKNWIYKVIHYPSNSIMYEREIVYY